jgi:hypothetical protein
LILRKPECPFNLLLLSKKLVMKKIFVIVVAGALLACNANDVKGPVAPEAGVATTANNTTAVDSASLTSIEWLDSTTQQLAPINEGQTPELTWRFKNTGDKPLVVESVTVGCGCTVAEKPEKPVLPGEDGVIKAKFNSSGKVGPNTKHVEVTANTKGSRTHELTFLVQVNSNKQ